VLDNCIDIGSVEHASIEAQCTASMWMQYIQGQGHLERHFKIIYSLAFSKLGNETSGGPKFTLTTVVYLRIQLLF